MINSGKCPLNNKKNMKVEFVFLMIESLTWIVRFWLLYCWSSSAGGVNWLCISIRSTMGGGYWYTSGCHDLLMKTSSIVVKTLQSISMTQSWDKWLAQLSFQTTVTSTFHDKKEYVRLQRDIATSEKTLIIDHGFTLPLEWDDERPWKWSWGWNGG